jgi:hypothetical protein
MKFMTLVTATDILVAVAGCGYLTGCSMLGGTSPKMNVSPAIPAAEATVHYKRTKNDNTAIEMKVKHLANPVKLTPPAHNYVVWVSSNATATPRNVGALLVDKDLTGMIDTVVPLHTFSLFITGEASGQVQEPTGPRLLWTDHNE